MSSYTMDMMVNAGGRDKNISMLSRGDWRNMIGCYDNRQEEGASPLMHKSFPAGASSSIPSLPAARPSLLTSRQSLLFARPTQTPQPSLHPARPIDKPKDFPYPWPKKESMFAVNNHIPNLPNGFYNQSPRSLKKDDPLYPPRRQINGFSERAMYNYNSSIPPHPMSALRASSDSSHNLQKNVTWKMNGMSSSSSTKSSPGSWNSLKETDKDIWENRMKESAELLKLYKHGYHDFNQNVYPGHHSKSVPNGFTEPGEPESIPNRDKIYLNINLQKDKISYEPLSKNANNPSPPYPARTNSPPRQMNGYKSNAGILISTESESKKKSFSVDNIIDRNPGERNGHVDDVDYRTSFEYSKSRLKSFRSNSISNLSDRVDSVKNGFTKSAFSPPHSSRTLPKPSDIPTSPEYPNTLMKTTELIRDHSPKESKLNVQNSPKESKLNVQNSPKENKLNLINLPKENKPINGQRLLENKMDDNNQGTEYVLPFKIKMKRSLAIYLGVDPEIDTVQYEPLNKNSSKESSQHGRHAFSSQHSRMNDIAHKDDREMRIQSKKKSVYSCGYDVNSINLMLQNAKKRFKCSDSS